MKIFFLLLCLTYYHQLAGLLTHFTCLLLYVIKYMNRHVNLFIFRISVEKFQLSEGFQQDPRGQRFRPWLLVRVCDKNINIYIIFYVYPTNYRYICYFRVYSNVHCQQIQNPVQILQTKILFLNSQHICGLFIEFISSCIWSWNAFLHQLVISIYPRIKILTI